MMGAASSGQLKRLGQRFALATGLTAARGQRWRARDLPDGSVEIFFGHHVVGDSDSPGLRASDLFDRIEYLRRTRTLVSLPEAVEWLRRPTRAARLAVLTFDDGYADNLTHLVPVLQASATPATIFVATAPVLDGGGLWFDRVRSALRDLDPRTLPLQPFVPPWQACSDAASARDTLLGWLKHCGPVDRGERLRVLEAQLPTVPPDKSARMLTLSELTRLAQEPLVTLGGHTHSHSVLSACALPELVSEIARNAEILRQVTGEWPAVFAYPNGRTGDFGEREKRALNGYGYAAAVSTVPGANPPGTDPFALARFPLGEGPCATFAWQIERAATAALHH